MERDFEVQKYLENLEANMEILKQALENYSLQMDNLRKKQEEMLVKLNEKIPKSNKFVKDMILTMRHDSHREEYLEMVDIQLIKSIRKFD